MEGADPCKLDRNNQTMLHYAAANPSSTVEHLQMIEQAGCDMRQTCVQKCTILHFVLIGERSMPQLEHTLEIVRWLVQEKN